LGNKKKTRNEKENEKWVMVLGCKTKNAKTRMRSEMKVRD